MRLLTNIYIDTATDLEGAASYERLELFDFQTIELTSSLQNVRDIGSVFTDFSQQFTIPASQLNNRLLKHFYSLYLTDGYDSRIKRKAFISLNGITFRNGYIRLSEASLSNGQPKSYSITFFGQIVSLKDILGDDELKSLSALSIYNHEYSKEMVYSGFKIGLGINGSGDVVESTDRDIIYPCISADNKWSYDSSTEGYPVVYKQGLDANLHVNTATGTYGIDYLQLKPAIKVKRLIEAIENEYTSIDFSDDFFADTDFSELYMLLHNTKGSMTTSTSGLSSEMVFTLSTGTQGDFTLDAGGVIGLIPIETSTRSEAGFPNLTKTCQVSVATEATAITGNGNYTVEIYKSDTLAASGSYSGVGANTLSFPLSSESVNFWDIVIKISSNNELNNFTLKPSIVVSEQTVEEDQYGENEVITTNYSSSYDSKLKTMLTEVVIYAQLPKIKVIDLLKGLFKMFNLTAYVEDGIVVVKRLDAFYSAGADRDISEELDVSDINIKRGELFSNINFEYSKPQTFGLIKQNEIAQDDFGNLEFQATPNGRSGSLVFDGGKYEIKLPFEKLFYERLSDEADLTADRPPFSYGWLVGKDQDATLTKPVLFFNDPTTITVGAGIGEYKFGFKDVGEYITIYNRPSNSTSTGSTSLNFGEELDEFSGNSMVNSLFNLNYSSYIANLFTKTARIVSYTAILSLKTLLNYKMNDRIYVNGNPYRINTIKTNLTSGKSNIELITDFDLPDTIAPTVPTNLVVSPTGVNQLTLNWTASTDAGGVTGYEVWVDSVLNSVIGVQNSYVITGLSEDTTYSVEILAFDGYENKSTKTTAVAGTTLVYDSTAPTDPSNLTTVDVRTTSIEFSWTYSSDAQGVTGYEVWVNNTYLRNIEPASSPYVLEDLQSNSSYGIKLLAFDALGNKSGFSNIITNTTN